MRLSLAGGVPSVPPITIQLENGSEFNAADYIALGYTNFEVICIGGGGGNGGDINPSDLGTSYRAMGGSGGGGGLHRVRGVLTALPPSVPITVGQGGTQGTFSLGDGSTTTDGGDGGASLFGDTAKASGGKGGKAAKYSLHDPLFYKVDTEGFTPSGADGGDGGVGNSATAGGGGAGGQAGSVPTPPGAAIPEFPANHYYTLVLPGDGTFDGTIGQGGGGGAGGTAKYGGPVTQFPTPGGRGSYSIVDDSVWAIGPDIGLDNLFSVQLILPGGAGGGKVVFPNSLPKYFGRTFGEHVDGEDGGVVISLTVAD